MRAMPCDSQAKGLPDVAKAFGDSVSSSLEVKCKKGATCASNEPNSVLDTRSPSPSTSTSTLSSSFGSSGGGGNSGCSNNGGGGTVDDAAVVLAVLDDSKWLGSFTPDGGLTEPRKDEWLAELQPISDGFVVSKGGNSQQFGTGLEDWESLLSESDVPPGQDQLLPRWISGDGDETSFTVKQLQQDGNCTGYDDVPAALEDIDQSTCLDRHFNCVPVSGISMANFTPFLAVRDFGVSACNNHSEKIALPTASGLNSNNSSVENLRFSLSTKNLGLPHQLQHHQFVGPDLKPPVFNTQILMNQPHDPHDPHDQGFLNPNVLSSLSFSGNLQDQLPVQPPSKRHNPGILNASHQIPKVPTDDPSRELLLRKQPHLQHSPRGLVIVPKQEGGGSENIAAQRHPLQEHQFVYDQLFKAAELIQAGNFSHAQLILARLNHQLSPIAKPFQRATFYFMEALQLTLLVPNPIMPLPPKIASPLDGMFKIGSYKLLSEISPLIQFMNFTSNQAILEALDVAERIHIVDFDIGFGAQWASFMQELPKRNRVVPSLKITAFASPSTHHPVEIGLMHENLSQFADEIGVSFELEVVNFDAFDPNSYSMALIQSSENDAVAVNFPIWSSSINLCALPSLICFIKQLSPKIVVALGHGCERTELSFSHHLLHAVQYYEVLLDSINAANLNAEAVDKIEKFLIHPRIGNSVLRRVQSPNPTPHWRNLFASAGFSPVALSNFAETQAECVAKRAQTGGFHVEKRQASLVLCWQRWELVSASAWSC